MKIAIGVAFFFFSSRRRHTRLQGDWSSDVCSSDLSHPPEHPANPTLCAGTSPVKRTTRKTKTAIDAIEIGRASCRERVLISVSDVIEKKKDRTQANRFHTARRYT